MYPRIVQRGFPHDVNPEEVVLFIPDPEVALPTTKTGRNFIKVSLPLTLLPFRR